MRLEQMSNERQLCLLVHQSTLTTALMQLDRIVRHFCRILVQILMQDVEYFEFDCFLVFFFSQNKMKCLYFTFTPLIFVQASACGPQNPLLYHAADINLNHLSAI